MIALVTFLVAKYSTPENPTPILGPEPTETVVVTNPLDSVAINRQLDFQGVHLTIKMAELAEKFSDDKNRQGKYTLRVEVDAINKGKDVIGLSYADTVFLVLPDGQKVHTKRMSVTPAAMPGVLQSGFFDYPLATQVDVTKLKLAFSDGTVIPFNQT